MEPQEQGTPAQSPGNSSPEPVMGRGGQAAQQAPGMGHGLRPGLGEGEEVDMDAGRVTSHFQGDRKGPWTRVREGEGHASHKRLPRPRALL